MYSAQWKEARTPAVPQQMVEEEESQILTVAAFMDVQPGGLWL